MTTRTFCPPPPRVLTENETFSSFANWQGNIKFYLSQNNDFAPFLSDNWSKTSVANHGFTDDAAEVAENIRKTAVQKSLMRDHMLGIIAQYGPPLLRNDIIKKSTNLDLETNKKILLAPTVGSELFKTLHHKKRRG